LRKKLSIVFCIAFLASSLRKLVIELREILNHCVQRCLFFRSAALTV
jgi:hypothetical protein